MIEAGNLFRIQSKLTLGDKSIPVESIEKNYILSWILVGIGQSGLCNALCFKGGTSLKKIYFTDYRFSEDLDFTVLDKSLLNGLDKKIESVLENIRDMANIRLSISGKEEHSNSNVIYLNYSGPLGAEITKRKITLFPG